MDNYKPRVLVISSVSPSIGPAVIGEQIYEALKQNGIEVDFMTKYPEPNHPEYLFAVKDGYDRRLLVRIKNKLRWLIVGGRPKEKGYCFFYTYEKFPPIPTKKVVDAIKKQYDLVYIVFWQEMLSFDTIESIYDKLHCLILIAGVDYSQMSGGCHFTNNCQNYKTGCGMCPAFHSKRKNDFTAWNVRFRKRVYDKIKPVIFGNLYMSHFYINSYLLKDARIEIGNPIINTNIFCPLDKDILRKKYMIDEKKKYIILFGSQDLGDERKGFKYLLKAFERLFKMMGQNSDKVLAITIGNNYEIIKKQIPFDSIGMGYVKMNQLPELYSLATCFVCTSVNDAGPMMVNQSLCCGTPVVGFDMGSVKQVVKDKGTGICVPLRDTDSLADGILSIFEMSSDDYKKTAARAREIAIQSSSYEAQANAILSVFQKYMT